MRIVLLGYGKMGRMIEGLAVEQGDEVVARLDSANDPLPADFDVVIDFTQPDAVLGNVQRIAATGKPLVMGTTGWAKEYDVVRQVVEEQGIGLVYSANFSIGVNIFFRLVAQAAQLMKDRSEYEAWAYEIHHSAKLDAPSGTLLQIVDSMRDAGYERKIDVASNRAGRVPGTHEIGFDSTADTITLTHTARSREGFARGALLAANLVQGKTGMLRFSDLLL